MFLLDEKNDESEYLIYLAVKNQHNSSSSPNRLGGKKCKEYNFKGILFKNNHWAWTVMKLLMTILLFISELVFSEMTWW